MRRHLQDTDEILDACGNHARLATPWSSGHTEETRTEFNSFLLFGIQMDDCLRRRTVGRSRSCSNSGWSH